MKEEKINIHRLSPILGIILSMVVASGVLCFINKLSANQIICVFFLVIAFIPVIIFELTYERQREMFAQNKQTTYKRIMVGVIVCCVMMIVISFWPEYFRPVILLPIIMSGFSNDMMGLIIGIFSNVLLALTTGGSFYELLAYTMLVLVGGMLSKSLKQAEYRMNVSLIYLCSSILFPSIFYYFANGTIEFSKLLLGAVNGILTALYVVGLYPNIREKTYREKHFYYTDILVDDYAQVKKIYRQSPLEYYHARKVSELAYKYALQLDLDIDLVSAAGFYYHLGKWLGEPQIENAVRKASELCFPEDLIQILKEYNGIEELPSTKESALIHIVDSVLVRMEQYEAELGPGKWNRESLIYQTITDFSNMGMYDKSGLSINSFIKIREWLTKEALLQ